jgi:GT2 family glycosyltransferase
MPNRSSSATPPTGAAGHRAPVSIILHGLRWPAAAAVAALRARLLDALPGAEIIEAREDAASAIGAAALMSASAARATGAILLFLEPSLLPSVEELRSVVAAASDSQCLTFMGRVDRQTHHSARSTAPGGSDLLSRLAAEFAHADASASQQGPLSRAAQGAATPAFAISRSAYDVIGGLDARLWSVGIADDLIARAAIAGVTVRHLDIAPESVAPPAYPLRPEVARLLTIRNALLIAFKTEHADALGETLARLGVQALLESWRGTGFSTDAFAFGGAWGRNAGALGSLRHHLTGRGGLEAPLADPDGCLLPLLAIDSMLDELSTAPSSSGGSAIDERNAWQRMSRGGHHAATDESTALLTNSALATAESRSKGQSDREMAHALPNRGSVAARLPGTPTVSVVVVNWNGKTHLRDCFGSLQRSDYPADKVELICVDNGSKDGSIEFLRAEFPRVKVVALDRNRGFTGGNEAGVREATGDVLVFLNNDMRVEPDFLRELVGALDADCSCAGARVLSWDGRAIDFIRGSLNFEGRGFQDSYGLPNLPELATPAETFFPNGGAFAVTRDAYDRAGGFDPAFFAYYDDVDLGWRLRLTGTNIRVVGRAVVYHRHGATSRTQPRGQKRFLMERNALWTLMKSYGGPALRRTLGPALALAIRRVLDECTLDPHAPLAQTLAPFVVRCRKRNAPQIWPAAAVYAEDDTNAGARRSRALAPQAAGAAAAAATGSTLPRTPASGALSPVRSLPLEALGALCAAVEALRSIAAARSSIRQRAP